MDLDRLKKLAGVNEPKEEETSVGENLSLIGTKKSQYQKKYNESIKNNNDFWKKEGKRITWIKSYKNVNKRLINFNYLVISKVLTSLNI